MEVARGHIAAVLKRFPSIDAILSFDDGGVSGHPNHRDVGRAAALAAREGGVVFMQLQSIPTVRVSWFTSDVGRSAF